MTDDAVLEVLTGRAGRAPIGVTWLPEQALDALFWGKASDSAEALGALVADVPLDFAVVPADVPWSEQAVWAIRTSGSEALWALPGPLSRVEVAMGATETLRASASEPSRLAAAIDRELHASLDLLRRGAALGVRVALVADDLASTEGPLVSPDYVLEALVPCYHRLAEEASGGGMIAAFHSDGDTRVLLPALRRAGYAAIHSGGLSGTRLASLARAAWASGLTVIGGLTSRQLRRGAREQAVRAVGLSREGPLLIADDGGIASAQELAAFVSAARAARTLLAGDSP